MTAAGCGNNGGTAGANAIPSGAAVVKVVADPTNSGAYMPATVTVKVNQAVAWQFEDGTSAHTVTSDNGAFDSREQKKGMVFTQTFADPGSLTYHCTVYPAMKGTITVTP